jgi:hypothetical protein
VTFTEENDGDVWIFTMDGDVTERDVVAWIVHLDEIARTASRRFAMIVDVRWTTGWGPPHGRRIRPWVRSRAEVLSASCDGIAFVADSPFVRGAMRYTFGLDHAPPFPATICGRRESADVWVATRQATGALDLFRAAV